MHTSRRNKFATLIINTYKLLQNPKLFYFFYVIAILQGCCYYIGQCFVPTISESHLVLADVCPRAPGAEIGDDKCNGNDRTFYFRMPFSTSDGGFNRWQYPLRFLLHLTEHTMQGNDTATDVINISLNMQLSYSDNSDGPWHVDSGAMAFLKVPCKKSDDGLVCRLIPVLMLEIMKHPFYMMTVKLLSVSRDLKKDGVTQLMLKVINQNESFCKYWIFVKCILSCLSGFMLHMFLDRMKAAERAATIFEKVLRLLLCTLLGLHLPLEQVLTVLGLPFGTSLSVLTSGVFFSTMSMTWLTYACAFLPPTAMTPNVTKQQRLRNCILYVIVCTLLITYHMYNTARRSLNPFYNAGDELYQWINIMNTTVGCIAFCYLTYAQIVTWRTGHVLIVRDSQPPLTRYRRLLVILFYGCLCTCQAVGSFVLAEIHNSQYALATWKWLDLETAPQGKSYFYICAYFTWTMCTHMLTMICQPVKIVPQHGRVRQESRAVEELAGDVAQEPMAEPQQQAVDGPTVRLIGHKKQKVK